MKYVLHSQCRERLSPSRYVSLPSGRLLRLVTNIIAINLTRIKLAKRIRLKPGCYTETAAPNVEHKWNYYCNKLNTLSFIDSTHLIIILLLHSYERLISLINIYLNYSLSSLFQTVISSVQLSNEIRRLFIQKTEINVFRHVDINYCRALSRSRLRFCSDI